MAVRVCVARLRTLLTNPSLRRRLLGGRRRPLVHTPGTEHLSPCTAIGGVFRAGGRIGPQPTRFAGSSNMSSAARDSFPAPTMV